MWVRQASPANLSTRRHPETAQAFAKRRPANEGSLYSHPANKIQFLSSRAKRGICSPQYQKTRVPHISRFSRCGCGKPIPQTPKPAVIQRKCRPSQREALPTKDLCTLRVPIRIPALVIPSKARDLGLGDFRPGCPTSRGLRDAGVGSQPHPKPAVILKKCRPSQREGLPTKDLCTLWVPVRIPAIVIPSKARDLLSCRPQEAVALSKSVAQANSERANRTAWVY